MVMKKIMVLITKPTSLLLACFIAFSFFTLVSADESDSDSFYEIRKLDSLDLVSLWHVGTDAEHLSNGNSIARFWVFNPIYQNTYHNKNVPVAVILVGGNHVDSIPVAYQVFSEKIARVTSATNGARENYHNDALFAFKFKESGCQVCEEGRMLIVKENNEFVLKTDNILMHSISE